MQTGSASGLQILFLSFAVMLLSVPLSSVIAAQMSMTGAEAAFIGRSVPFFLGAMALLAFTPLRDRTFAYLKRPIPRDRRGEVALVGAASVLIAFSTVAALVLWNWTTQGSASLAYQFESIATKMQSQAVSWPGMLTAILLGAIFAPFVEEILYRGLLQDAWAAKYGAFTTTIVTSALFAWYHDNPYTSFACALVFSSLVRRTGTLWSAIAVHSLYNSMIWYPVLGRFIVLDPSHNLGDLATWSFHLACLLIAAVALPAYILLAALRPYEPPVELP